MVAASEHLKALLELLSEEIVRRNNKINAMLDLGCGNRESTEVIARALNVKEVHGVDIDEKALKEAAARGIKVVKADLNKDSLPFPSNYFDLVTMIEVIEHLYNTDHALMEVWRVLKPGGYLALTTPNLAWWVNRLVLLVGYQPYFTNVSLRYDVGKPMRNPLSTGCRGEHIRLFTVRALRQLLEFYGFRIIKIRGASDRLLPKLLFTIDKLIAKIRPQLGAHMVVLAIKTQTYLHADPAQAA